MYTKNIGTRKRATTIIGENGKKMYPVGKWGKIFSCIL